MTLPSPPERRSLPGGYLLLLIETVKRWQVTAEQVLAASALTVADLRDPLARLDEADFNRALKRALLLTGEPALGFYLGMQMKLSSHGFIGLAAMTAKNVQEALDIAQRFTRLRMSAINLRLEVVGEQASLYIDQTSPDYFLGEVAVFALLVGLAQMGMAATGKQLEGRADTRFARPDYFGHFAHLLSGPVHFNQPCNRLVFAATYLQLPLVMSDPVAAQLAREQCERELAALGERSSVVQQVRSLIYSEAAGFHSVEQVAEQLHMSERTLKRQLAQQGTTYSDILEELRRQKATQLLGQRELSIDHIAERLNYSDVANFTRAFKRWTGQTPGQFRKK